MFFLLFANFQHCSRIFAESVVLEYLKRAEDTAFAVASCGSNEIKFPFLSIQLPILISCPWCQFLCFKLVWKGNLKCPRKNYFLPWLVESATGNQTSCPLTTDSVSQGGFLSSSVENLHIFPPGFLDARQTVINLHRSLPSLTLPEDYEIERKGRRESVVWRIGDGGKGFFNGSPRDQLNKKWKVATATIREL
ncbi:hypothetical protein NE237_024545 [Protea cynaroides]|uniref:Uncharacterized protein n=1 Tax=Protea cynaroides TaxID=273540 RepID=A0A9Q0H1E7_9MAGN|nr:hypothetical protein NE237_024545 [Protea cynaroides]